MTGRSSTRRTDLCLLALLLSCLSSGVFVVGEPEPEPIPSELLYSKSFINNAENLVMIEEKEDITEREKELDDVQRMLESVLKARAKDNYSDEELPVPPNPPNRLAPRSGKRTAISCEYRLTFFFNHLSARMTVVWYIRFGSNSTAGSSWRRERDLPNESPSYEL
ncbi:hypothetical protein WN51_09116 [Melipona quadrifasciata]|uniref:Uncharacterized protein n=1 Tax=Melipona quadrifasciata TaxID=166423 RepID=A0A0N0BJQ8_9HYME|nr:hypothetical protein WN51_09116 [Melipona quadrifasciata]